MGPPPPHLSFWSHLARMGHTCVSPLHPRRERLNSQPRWPLNYSCTLGFWLRLQRGTYLSEVKPLEMPFISIESC